MGTNKDSINCDLHHCKDTNTLTLFIKRAYSIHISQIDFNDLMCERVLTHTHTTSLLYLPWAVRGYH